jgi:branched-chain amino acid transport system substrate-binding protein
MRVKSLLVAAMALAVSMIWTLGAGSARTSTSAGTPIIIGAASAKSGYMSQYDIPNVIGAQFAIDDINKAGGVLGHPLKLRQVDTKSSQTQSATAGTQLIDGGAYALIVSCDFDFGGPAATVAQAKNHISFGCAASPKFGPQGIGPDAFTMESLTNGEGANVAEWAYKKQHWRHPFILQDDFIDYTKTLGSYFKTRWLQLAGAKSRVGKATFNNQDTSIATQIAKIRQAKPKPDFIFLPSCPPGGATATRQIRSAGITIPIVGGICMDGDYWLKSIPHLANFYNNAEVSSYLDDPNPKINAFIRKVLKKMGGNSAQPYLAVEGYSEVQAIAIAIKRAKSLDTDKVRVQLEHFKNVPLLIAPTTFTPQLHGDAHRRYAILVVKNGHHHFVTEWQTQKPPPVTQ